MLLFALAAMRGDVMASPLDRNRCKTVNSTGSSDSCSMPYNYTILSEDAKLTLLQHTKRTNHLLTKLIPCSGVLVKICLGFIHLQQGVCNWSGVDRVGPNSGLDRYTLEMASP